MTEDLKLFFFHFPPGEGGSSSSDLSLRLFFFALFSFQPSCVFRPRFLIPSAASHLFWLFIFGSVVFPAENSNRVAPAEVPGPSSVLFFLFVCLFRSTVLMQQARSQCHLAYKDNKATQSGPLELTHSV